MTQPRVLAAGGRLKFWLQQRGLDMVKGHAHNILGCST